MSNINIDTPSDNCSCTFKCFRAIKLYKPVCWSDCVIVGFDQDGEYLLNSQSSLLRRMRSVQGFTIYLFETKKAKLVSKKLFERTFISIIGA